jgi:hypothetical protein
MTYPEDFSKEARARIVNAKVKGQRAFREAESRGMPVPLASAVRYVMAMFHAFLKEACPFGRSGAWGVDHLEELAQKWIYSTILFAESDMGAQGDSFRRMLTESGMGVRSQILALFKLEPEWKFYEDQLIEISDMQASGSEEVGTTIPIRGHRSEIRGWMRDKEITSVKEAANQLHVSESTLKSIMTSKGDVRHSQETVEAILRKIRAPKTGE